MALKQSSFLVATKTLVTLWLAAPANAVVPEIKVDEATGIATPHPDLVAALAEIETPDDKINLAQIDWQRAPWHRS